MWPGALQQSKETDSKDMLIKNLFVICQKQPNKQNMFYTQMELRIHFDNENVISWRQDYPHFALANVSLTF